ncbi:MAG: 3-dehydroquinate synthase, partial [Alistipes sp.]|nr:3-dehydroquinate synthase [Alistipes sp.]
RIVGQDPHEKHLRKTLNLGHTVGHAIESHALAHGRVVPHGYAVAWGLVCALILSNRLYGFPSHIIYDLARYVESHYGAYHITCDDYDELLGYMQRDKKNIGAEIKFTLLRNLGQCEVSVSVSREEIEIALDFYRDLFYL